MSVRTASRAIKQTTLRHLWLASLGAVAVTRDGVSGAAGQLARDADALRARAQGVAHDGRLVLRGGLLTLQESLQARIQPIAAQARHRLAAGAFAALGALEARFVDTRNTHRPVGRSPRRSTGQSARARR